ncbi:MAG: hypothetical protein MZU79_06015 [Anaerotruncus sp.]|nr:hypothetical protein [Anaerotruncus sp.]
MSSPTTPYSKAGGTTVALNTENTAEDIGYIAPRLRRPVPHRQRADLVEGVHVAPGGTPSPSPARGRHARMRSSSGTRPEASPEGWAIGLPSSGFLRHPRTVRATIPACAMIDLDVASIVYTSGSTGQAPRRRAFPPEHRVEHPIDRRLSRTDAGGPGPGRPAVLLHLRQITPEHPLLRRRLRRRGQQVPLSERRPPDDAGTGRDGIRRRAVDLSPSSSADPISRP